MKNTKKIIYVIGTLEWAALIGMTVVFIIEGRMVTPVCVLMPSIGCLLHFIEKLVQIGIKEDEELIKEITK